jgi:hypothetical protein
MGVIDGQTNRDEHLGIGNQTIHGFHDLLLSRVPVDGWSVHNTNDDDMIANQFRTTDWSRLRARRVLPEYSTTCRKMRTVGERGSRRATQTNSRMSQTHAPLQTKKTSTNHALDELLLELLRHGELLDLHLERELGQRTRDLDATNKTSRLPRHQNTSQFLKERHGRITSATRLKIRDAKALNWKHCLGTHHITSHHITSHHITSLVLPAPARGEDLLKVQHSMKETGLVVLHPCRVCERRHGHTAQYAACACG